MKNFDTARKLAREYAEKLKKGKGIVSIVQIGSSLRREDFTPDSDLDFLVIYENPVKNFIEVGNIGRVEINLIRHGRKQFIKSLEEGNPVDLVALKFGKILYDKGFFKGLKKRGFRPAKMTREKWIHTAILNLMDAAMNYSLPFCICRYFKALHHAAREFCRVVILKEQGKLLEGDRAVLEGLKANHPDLQKKFRLIIRGRGDSEKFEQKCIEYPKIKGTGLGRYLLAAEDIAIKALKISMGLNVPKVNKLISQLQKKYEIEQYHSFHIIPECRELMLHLILKGDKSAFFRYSLENGELIKADIHEIKGTGKDVSV